MSMFVKIARFICAPYFEKRYKIGCLAARVVTQTLYRTQFQSVGNRTWVKKPSQIFNPSNIAIGKDVRIEAGCVLYSVSKYAEATYDGRITIGDGVFANNGLKLSAVSSITVGEGVAFGYNVFITDFDHDYTDLAIPILATPLVTKGPVSIGKHSWIGANVFISSGVQLGQHCVVAANSVVTKSFPANSVIGGNPARIIRQFDAQEGAWVTAKA
ncbi:acetyltransferase [Pigmentiphaga litoralis]|nr:acetyltransferase [Pigmentiphaga litoralis]